jgi:hypothetical protein
MFAGPQESGFEWLWRRGAAPRGCNISSRVSALRVPILVGFIATLVYLGIGEIVVRIATHNSLITFPDFRVVRLPPVAFHDAIEYDALLGWRLKAFLHSQGFNTIEFGFRSNGVEGAHVRTGGVLAVGSSFTAGSEVTDAETWSAHLERLIDAPVNNAGQGGHNADQIIMRAEQLLPTIRPEVVVVDLIPDNVVGAGYSSYGWPKPYFTLQDGLLVAHNQPVPTVPEAPRDGSALKAIFSRSILVDRFMAAFFSDYWFSSGRSGFVQTDADAIGVTCRLLDRLKVQTNAAGVRLILYLQYASSHIISTPQQAIQSAKVKECAEASAIEVIDEFSSLKTLYTRDPEGLRAYYVKETDGTLGHKSSLGNLQVAKMIEAALKEKPIKRLLPSR